LTLVSYQKIKELGILKVLGATKWSVIKIVISYSLKRSLKGASYGILFGLLVILIQNKYSIIKIPSQIYFVQALPMVVSFNDFLLVTILSAIFILFSSFLTGMNISRLNIIKALKWNK
jgi:lipoprotein-releasing system permease protein